MILEGLVTTVDRAGRLNVAPMGPIADEQVTSLKLRPFRSSRTYANLKEHPYGVFHVTDDVLLLAKAAIGALDVLPETFPAERIPGRVVASACRWYEFEVVACDDSKERAEIDARIVHAGRLRDFVGFHRARHAVIEAAILATRVHLLPREEILSEFARLRILVEKTSGPREGEAFALLEEYVHSHPRSRSENSRGNSKPNVEPASLPQSVTVTTGARLHFGLFAPGAGAGRRLGGLGMMIGPAGFAVRATTADHDKVVASDEWRSRAAAFLDTCRNRTPRGAQQPPPCRLEIARALPAHAGLGSGTQLGLAVAQAMAALAGEGDVSAVELARRAGRGLRSAVGLHGFACGGLIVEGGKSASEEISPLVARAAVPEQWRMVLIRPRGAAGISGGDERDRLARLPAMPQPVTDRLCRLTLLDLLPAVALADLDAAGEALFEIGRLAGEHFAPVQGGLYADPQMRNLVEVLRSRGICGVSQTSWGPTLFVLRRDADSADRLKAEIEADTRWSNCEVSVAVPLNRGATIETG